MRTQNRRTLNWHPMKIRAYNCIRVSQMKKHPISEDMWVAWWGVWRHLKKLNGRKLGLRARSLDLPGAYSFSFRCSLTYTVSPWFTARPSDSIRNALNSAGVISSNPTVFE